MSYHPSIKPFWHPCPSDTSPDCEHRLLGKRGLSSETGHSPDDKSLDACQCYIFYILNISKTSHTSCISRLLNITSILPYSLKILLNSEGNIAENIYARVHFENREREFEWDQDFNVFGVKSVTLVSFHKADFEQCQRWWNPVSFLEAE